MTNLEKSRAVAQFIRDICGDCAATMEAEFGTLWRANNCNADDTAEREANRAALYDTFASDPTLAALMA